MSAHQYAETTQPSGQHAKRDRPRIFEKFPARISHSKRQHDHQPALFSVQAATRHSRFELASDQMLVVDLDVPDDRNWSISLYNIWGDALDFQNRQTSLNGWLAHVDADGKVRLVIGASDPGHPNWLDTAENRRGIICYRLLDCTRVPAEPQCIVVPTE